VIQPIADAIVLILVFLHGVVGNYTAAIILLTLAIKVVLHPLTRQSLKSMKAMQALAPQMAVLREKYRDDPRAMNTEMMNLYRANHVNPFSGCLPQLVQLPVLYGLFAALRRPGLFGGETFLGAGLDQMPSFPAIAHDPVLVIYPLLVGLATYLQQRMTVTDPQQARMFVFMPVLVAYFATNFQVGLSIYWIVSTLAYALEYLIIVGRPTPAPAGAPAPPKAMPFILPQRPKGTKKK
jgi:YidC/Oxa1 family membrane protein insertase